MESKLLASSLAASGSRCCYYCRRRVLTSSSIQYDNHATTLHSSSVKNYSLSSFFLSTDKVHQNVKNDVNYNGGGGGNGSGGEEREPPYSDHDEEEEEEEEPVSPYKDFIAGTFGGIGGIIAGHPLDTVKVKIQTNPTYSGSVIKSFMRVLKHEGIANGLYKGMGSPIIGVGIINAIIFGVYGNTIRALHSFRKANGHYGENEDDEIFEPLYSDIFFAGALAGGINCAVLTPIDLVKCQLQVQSDNLAKQNLTNKKGMMYRGPWDCIKKIVRSSGVRALYQGNVASLYREIPSYGMYFITYEYFRRRWGENPLALFVAGGLGGVAAWVVSYPFDVVKSRMQSLPEKPNPGHDMYKGFWDCTKKLHKEGGTRIFFKGFNACLVRAFPTNAVTFLVYEMTMKYF